MDDYQNEWRSLPPAPVSGAAVLTGMADFISRYTVFPNEHCLPAVTLWAAHTWLSEEFYATPRLVLDSGEPGSGKTRVLEVLSLLCRGSEMIFSPTAASIFRLLAEKPCTLLFDETDTVFRGGRGNEDLRALLNAGYKRTATIPRCTSRSSGISRFRVYSPVVLAGLAGAMPDTITTRAVTIHMRRRRAGEHIEPYEEEIAEQESAPLREALSTWARAPETVASVHTRPALPDGVADRSAEIWRPLIAIADAAGGTWPDLARDACRHFVLDREPEIPPVGAQLLTDMRDVFRRAGAQRLPTETILAELNSLRGAADGGPLDARKLAQELARYDVCPTLLRTPDGPLRGYEVRGPMQEAWSQEL